MNNWHLAITVDVGGAIGFGHLRRCIAIASRASQMDAQIEFHLAGDVASGCRLVEAAGFGCWPNKVDVAAGTLVLVDRVHSQVLRQPEVLMADIARWRGQGVLVAVIDGAGTDSLRHQCPNLKVDLLIAPYAGERGEKEHARLLAGPEFAPLAVDYENFAPREIRNAADRILVTCGGSDPFEITATVMKALAEIQDRHLTIRVVLGPGFELAYCVKLADMGRTSTHDFEWIKAPESLTSHMRWCDLAVATSGLTKYELAAAGIPAILISTDEMHARANEPFAALGTAIELGTIDRVGPADIAKTLCALLDDYTQRSTMARAGNRAIDGRGATRIAKALKEVAYAEA